MYLQIKYCFEHEYNMDKDKLGALSFHVSLNPPPPQWSVVPGATLCTWPVEPPIVTRLGWSPPLALDQLCEVCYTQRKLLPGGRCVWVRTAARLLWRKYVENVDAHAKVWRKATGILCVNKKKYFMIKKKLYRTDSDIMYIKVTSPTKEWSLGDRKSLCW